MVTEAIAISQLIRGRGLRNFTSDPAAWTEVVTALMKSARSLEHARAIMDRVLHDLKFFPTPAEIYEAASQVEPPEFTRHYSGLRACPECGGSGYATGLWLVTWERSGRKRERIDRQSAKLLEGKLGGIGTQELYEASEYCGCEYGQHLATAKAMREQESAE